jgi:hypothetical protein
MPPEADIDWEYAVPTVALARLDGDTVMVGAAIVSVSGIAVV